MVAILQWASILATLGWMTAVFLGTAKSSDPLWALSAFRYVLPGDGVFLLGSYLACSVVLPLVGLRCLGAKIARRVSSRVVMGGAVGVGIGLYLDYLQFAIPFAGGITNVPGLPAALVLYGNERLAGIWAFAFCTNIAFLGTLGSLLGIASGRYRRSVDSSESGDARVAQQKENSGAVNRVAGALIVSVLLCIVALWRFGPGTVGVAALLAEFDVAPGVRFVRDVTYARPGGIELKLDLCKPARSDDRLPAVVCIHGGGWRGGRRSEYVPLIVQFARRAYVSVTIDYRLAPAHRFPAQAEDVRSAIRWLRQHADEFGVDPDRIGLLGWSAGGHLACFVGVTGTSAESRSDGFTYPTDLRPAAIVQAVVSFSGMTDLTADYWNVISSGRRALIGDGSAQNPVAYRSASPLAHVDRNEPPFLLLHGSADPVVPLDQSQRFRDRLEAAGGAVSLREYDGQGHRWFGARLRDANHEALAFFDRYLKGPAGASAVGATEGGSE